MSISGLSHDGRWKKWLRALSARGAIPSLASALERVPPTQPHCFPILSPRCRRSLRVIFFLQRGRMSSAVVSAAEKVRSSLCARALLCKRHSGAFRVHPSSSFSSPRQEATAGVIKPWKAVWDAASSDFYYWHPSGEVSWIKPTNAEVRSFVGARWRPSRARSPQVRELAPAPATRRAPAAAAAAADDEAARGLDGGA